MAQMRWLLGRHSDLERSLAGAGGGGGGGGFDIEARGGGGGGGGGGEAAADVDGRWSPRQIDLSPCMMKDTELSQEREFSIASRARIFSWSGRRSHRLRSRLASRCCVFDVLFRRCRCNARVVASWRVDLRRSREESGQWAEAVPGFRRT